MQTNCISYFVGIQLKIVVKFLIKSRYFANPKGLKNIDLKLFLNQNDVTTLESKSNILISYL